MRSGDPHSVKCFTCAVELSQHTIELVLGEDRFPEYERLCARAIVESDDSLVMCANEACSNAFERVAAKLEDIDDKVSERECVRGVMESDHLTKQQRE